MNKTFRLPRRARVIQIHELTRTGTFLVCFDVIDDEPFDFWPGQFVAIDCETRDWGYRRSPYCIASPPDRSRTFQLLVRRISTGPVSLFITDLKVGDVISFRGPTGASMVPKELDTELILLATGVGISPYLSLLQYLLPNGVKRKIQLYWGLRLQEDICLTPEFDELQRAYPNFSYQITLSQPPEFWAGLRGRLSESVPPLLQTLQNKHFYLSGNGAMIAEWSAVLSDFGVTRSLLFEEYFFNFHYNPDDAALHKLYSRFTTTDTASPYLQAQSLLENLSF